MELKQKIKSLYIHIPFCNDICSYCDFCKVYYDEKIVDLYLERLKQDLDALKIEEPLDTIYIGGGTPSCLSERQLQSLMKWIQPFVYKTTQEITIECNPESINKEKLVILKKGNVNRLSIGVQTFQDAILKQMERKHNASDAIHCIKMAKELGFSNISIDLMYGLPSQTLMDIKKDLLLVKDLDIQHVSYYSLILEEHTILKHTKFQKISEELEDKMSQYIDHTLLDLGFYQYEISNYSKTGFQSKHNLTYWHFNNYYGIGLGASAKIDDVIYENSRNLQKYVKGDPITTKTILSKKDQIFMFIMMSLRLVEGINIKVMKDRYDYDLLQEKKEVIDKYVTLSLLERKGDNLCCSKRGLSVLNTILIDFME